MLNNITIRVAPISNRIVLARFGKDKTRALETRDIMNEFLQALCSYTFDGKMPNKGEKVELNFGGGDEQFTMILGRV